MTMSVTEVRDTGAAVLDEVERAVVGKRGTLHQVLVAILAGGHVLLEDVPGLGKTLTARAFARVLDLDFRRIQFTPDLMPADVTGSSVWDQHRSTFEFRPGPIFCNLLLADEINRTPPKTQSALLEAMGEQQVSVEGSTRVLDPPFIVLATQNPIEYEGTYPLPEAQLDRFLFRLTFGYPDADQEWSILERRLARDRDEVDLRPLLPRETLLAMREAVEHVHVDPGIGRYLVALSAATRATTGVEVGVSPRGTLAADAGGASTRCAHRPGLRRPRGHQGPRRARARPSDRGPPRPLGPRPPGAQRGAGVPRCGPHACHRGRALTAARTSAASPAATVHDGRGGRAGAELADVTWTRTGIVRPVAVLVLALGGLVVGLVLARPDLVTIGAGLGLVAAVSLAWPPPPTVRCTLAVDVHRTFEGDPVTITGTVDADAPTGRLDLAVAVPGHWRVTGGHRLAATTLDRGHRWTNRVTIATDRWGSYDLGGAALLWTPPTGIGAAETLVSTPLDVRVLPDPSRLPVLVRPARTRVHAGDHRTRARGTGTDHADSRPFLPGDDRRAVNWRLTARLGEPWVDERHPERATDIVLLLDTFDAAALGDGVRAAGALGAAYLAAHDRVGLVAFGGSMRWLRADGGRYHEQLLLDALTGIRHFDTDAARDLSSVPAAALPPNALVLAITPLADPRTIGILDDLHARGSDLAIVEIVPVTADVRGPTAATVGRLWRLERRAMRQRFVRRGVAVATWDGEAPLAAALEELAVLRRYTRRQAR